MIVILCESWKAACKAYSLFLNFLEDNEPWSIKTIYNHTNCVETDDDLRYIFVDYRMQNVFNDLRPDIIYAQDFFEGISYYYDYYEIFNYLDIMED